MTQKQLTKKLQRAFEKVTYADCLRFYFNDEQVKELNLKLTGLPNIPETRFYILKMAVTLAKLQKIEEGEMPKDCWEKALKALPNPKEN